jgi:hypothetical protein
MGAHKSRWKGGRCPVVAVNRNVLSTLEFCTLVGSFKFDFPELVLRVRELFPDPDGQYTNYRPKGKRYPILQCFGSGSGWIRIQLGPGSGSVFGIRIRIPDRIQMSKNRFKKLTFTITDFKYENRKML